MAFCDWCRLESETDDKCAWCKRPFLRGSYVSSGYSRPATELLREHDGDVDRTLPIGGAIIGVGVLALVIYSLFFYDKPGTGIDPKHQIAKTEQSWSGSKPGPQSLGASSGSTRPAVNPPAASTVSTRPAPSLSASNPSAVAQNTAGSALSISSGRAIFTDGMEASPVFIKKASASLVVDGAGSYRVAASIVLENSGNRNIVAVKLTLVADATEIRLRPYEGDLKSPKVLERFRLAPGETLTLQAISEALDRGIPADARKILRLEARSEGATMSFYDEIPIG